MLRYKIRSGERVVLYDNSDFTGHKTEVYGAHVNSDGQSINVFVDILEENETSYRIRVFKPNGEIIVGWFLGKVLQGIIQIHDEHLLFDGRFNSDRVFTTAPHTVDGRFNPKVFAIHPTKGE